MTDTTEFTAQSPAREAWRMFRRNIPALCGVVMLSLIILMTIYGTLFYGGDPYDIVWAPQEPPGIGRQALHILALTLREDGVEGER